MFWDALVAGLKVLTYWETYVAGLEYVAIFLVPSFVLGMFMEKSDGIKDAVGCLSTLLLPVLQVVGMIVFALTLAPIIFGFADDAAWSFPWRVITLAPVAFFTLLGVLVVVGVALAFIPFLGQLQSLHTLVLGGMALRFVLGLLDSNDPGITKEGVNFIPGFWFLVGLLLIGGLMWLVAILLVAAIDTAKKGLGQIIAIPIAAILGFFPVFMYGAWLGAQVRGGF